MEAEIVPLDARISRLDAIGKLDMLWVDKVLNCGDNAAGILLE
jgi:hypothetical protein